VKHPANKSLEELRKEYGRSVLLFIAFGLLAIFDIAYGLTFLFQPTHPLDPAMSVVCFALAIWANYQATRAQRRYKLLEPRLMAHREGKKND